MPNPGAEAAPTGPLEGLRLLLQEIQATLEARFDRHEEVLGCLIAQQQRLEASLRRPRTAEERLSSRGGIFPEDEQLAKVCAPLSEEVPHPSKARLSAEERPTKIVEGGILARAYQRMSGDLIPPSQQPASPADESPQSPHEDEGVEDRGAASPKTPMRPKEEVSPVRRLLLAVKDPSFDIGCGVMVLLNTVLIGVETEFMAVHNGLTHIGFVSGQLGLNLWFTCELALRIVADNCRFLTSADWKWNLFDAVLVVFSIMDVVQATVARTDGMVVTGRLLRILRLSRVVRTLRLCRSLNYIHQFRKMVYSLQASITTLLWSLLLLFFMMFAFALMFVQGAVEYMGENSADSGTHGKELKGLYGSVLKACMTLYMAISNGQSWVVLIEPLESVGDDVYVALFLLYIFISTCGVLNVISAVFVESAMASAAHYKDLRIYESRKAKGELVRHMREVFKQIDEDDSGEINFQEMDQLLTDPQLKMYVESLEVTVEDTAMLFRLLDLDDSGVVDIDEFCNGLMRLQGDARSFDVHLLIFEMSKLQKRWDKFVGYVEFTLDELLDATVSPQVRTSAWSRVQQWRFANSARSRWGKSVSRSRESSSSTTYYFSQDARPKGTNATARRVESENSRRAGNFQETLPDIRESPGMQEMSERNHQKPDTRHGSV